MALSGGVDSAVSAALLKKAGYDVTGAFMINYDGKRENGESCWVPEYRDAVRVAAKLNIPILKLDFTKEYRAAVLEYLFKEYEAGRTPNPDVLCNSYIKFGSWLKEARERGFDCFATGHYAHLGIADSKMELLQAKDKNKDQTYFLHQLSQPQLKHVLFPIGGYTKPQVRALAKKFKLPVARKEESMGICFIGEVPMEEFLKTRIKPKPGKIVLSEYAAHATANVGATPQSSQQLVIGEHTGLAFYTIGQRHIGVASGTANKPLYVVGKNLKKNELVVGYEDDPLLVSKDARIANAHWISGREPEFPLQCEVRLRHRQPLERCVVTKADSGLHVTFKTPQRAVTPGQFAVFYQGRECLGGGVIE